MILHPSRRQLVAVAAILAVGAFLRTVQYGALTSMWLDELALALNVTARSFAELLLRPLDLNQVAPPGFLALEKAGTALLGEGEAGLRFFPWLAGLGSLVLFWRVASRAVVGIDLLAGLMVFAASPALVWQAGTAKQYSGDVFVTLFLVLLALRLDEGRMGRRGALAWGAIGGVAILASQPAVLVAAGLVLSLLGRRLRARRPLGPVLALGTGWALGAAVVTAAALLVVTPETREVMRQMWSNDFPLTARQGPLAWSLRLVGVLGYLLVYVTPKSIPEIAFLCLFAALVPVGAWSLARRRSVVGLFLAIPVLAAVLAGILQLLPLHRRIALYAGPSLLVAAMAAPAEIRGRLSGRARGLTTAALLGLFAVPVVVVLAVGRPPYRAEETRPVLAELAARWQPGDVLYVYFAADHAMRFYGPDVDWIPGVPGEGDSRTYFRQIDALRGKRRVWFFYSHGLPCEPEAIRSYLDAIGTEIDSIPDPYGLQGQRAAAALLYDLGDPVLLARADAETHPHPVSTAPFWEDQGCGYSRRPHSSDTEGKGP